MACLSKRETLNYSNFSFSAEALFRLYRQTFPVYESIHHTRVSPTPTTPVSSLNNPPGESASASNDEAVLEDFHNPPAWRLPEGVLPREWRTADHRAFFPGLTHCRREITSEFDYFLMSVKGRMGRESGEQIRHKESPRSKASSTLEKYFNNEMLSDGQYHSNEKELGHKKQERHKNFTSSFSTSNSKVDSEDFVAHNFINTTPTMPIPHYSSDPSKDAQQLSKANISIDPINFSISPCSNSRKNESKLNDTQMISIHELSRLHGVLKRVVADVEDDFRRSRNTAFMLVLATLVYLISVHIFKCIFKVVVVTKKKKRNSKCHSLLQRRTSSIDANNASKAAPLLVMKHQNNTQADKNPPFSQCLDDEYVYKGSSALTSLNNSDYFVNRQPYNDSSTKQLHHSTLSSRKNQEHKHVRILDSKQQRLNSHQSSNFATLPHNPMPQPSHTYHPHHTIHPNSKLFYPQPQHSTSYLSSQNFIAQNNLQQKYTKGNDQLLRSIHNSLLSTNFCFKKAAREGVDESNANTLTSIVEATSEHNVGDVEDEHTTVVEGAKANILEGTNSNSNKICGGVDHYKSTFNNKSQNNSNDNKINNNKNNNNNNSSVINDNSTHKNNNDNCREDSNPSSLKPFVSGLKIATV